MNMRGIIKYNGIENIPKYVDPYFFLNIFFNKSRTAGLQVGHKPKTKLGSEINRFLIKLL